MDYLIMAGQLILSLSILIVLHEMGHFLPAKLFGTRVEKFYLFFDPWFSLFKYKRGETEYGIGWLPLGGYVKISGMIDESMDLEQMKEPAQPWEFRSKPAWQRLIIMLGGVTVNFILGFLIYGMVLFVWGEEYYPSENITHGIYADSLGTMMGLQDGDKIISVGDMAFDKFSEGLVKREIIINSANVIRVERNKREMDIPIDEKFIGILTDSKNKNQSLFGPRIPFVISDFVDKSPAEQAGLKKGDWLIAVNGKEMPYFYQYPSYLNGYKGQPVNVSALRNNRDTVNLQVKLSEEGRLGAYYAPPETRREEYTFLEALPAGTMKGWNLLADQIKAFGQIFKGKIKASESLGGFGTIGRMFGGTWIWENFWKMTAVISLILAFMNLLPIPALDGGHVMFLLYEMVTGRKPSDKFMEYATIIGFVLVISLVLYANILDFLR